MAHVDGHGDAPGDHVSRIRTDLHEAHRGAAVGRVAQRQRVHRLDESRRPAQRVVARFHRRRTGVRILPRPHAVVPAQTQRAGHHADGLVLALENRPLLDVRLEICVERALADWCAAGIADAPERFTE